MNLRKLNPWNWFKHEEGSGAGSVLPVTRAEAEPRGSPVEAQSFGPLLRLQREMDRVFDEALGSFGLTAARSIWGRDKNDDLLRPSVDVSGDDSSYEIALDLPGVKESDISIEIRGDVLTVKGEKQESHEQKDQQFYRIERSYGIFQRTLALPQDADKDNVKATLKDGVLRLKIPRLELPDAAVKRIAIESR